MDMYAAEPGYIFMSVCSPTILSIRIFTMQFGSVLRQKSSNPKLKSDAV